MAEADFESPTVAMSPSGTPGFRRNHWAGRKPNFAAAFPKLEPLSYLQMTRLVRAAQAGDVDATRTVWLHMARLTYSVINNFNVPPQLFDDCLQAGVLGLARAIQKHEIERLNDFSTYAWMWIFQAIHRNLTHNRFHGHIPAHLYAEYSVFSHECRTATEPNEWFDWFTRRRLENPSHWRTLRRIHALVQARRFGLRPPKVAVDVSGPARSAERSDTACHVRACLDRLLPRERDVLMRRYGIGGHAEQTLEQIGTVYGVTRERIRQIEAKAEDRIRLFLTPHASLDPGWLRPNPGSVHIWSGGPPFDDGETPPPDDGTIPADPDATSGVTAQPQSDDLTPPGTDAGGWPDADDLIATADDPWPIPSLNSANCSASSSSSTTPTSTSASTAS